MIGTGRTALGSCSSRLGPGAIALVPAAAGGSAARSCSTHGTPAPPS